MNIDWREIEVFLAVAGELHFGRAATKLHLSQARVSQSVKSLETRIGAPLFERSTRRVALTHIGAELLHALAPAHAMVTESMRQARESARSASGVITISFLGTLAARTAVDICSELNVEQPGLSGELVEAPLTDPYQPAREHEADIAIVQFPMREPGFTQGPVILREPWVLGVAADHPLAARQTVSLEHLADFQIFRPGGTPTQQWLDNYLPWTTPSGRPIPRGHTVTTFQQMLALTAYGEGVSPMGAHNVRYHPRSDLAYVPIFDAPPLEFGLAWLTSAQNARILTFIEITRRIIDQWGGPAAAAQR
jgi:DNA-binding transcriptional LysR family regulator